MKQRLNSYACLGLHPKGGGMGAVALMRRVLCAAGIALSLAACADSVAIPGRTVGGLPHASLRGELYSPKGDGPFPAVVILHGCSGVTEQQRMWARRLAEWNYVALVLDSFGPRGASDVCLNANRVSPHTRMIDAYLAADYLRSLPIVADQKIGAMGFSHGGWTVIQLNARIAELARSRPIDAIVAVYPWCEAQSILYLDAPTLILIGEDDDWTPADRCRLAEEYLRTEPQRPNVDFVFYPGARHAYDVPGLNARVQGVAAGGITTRYLQYNAEAARDTARRTREWFDRHLKR